MLLGLGKRARMKTALVGIFSAATILGCSSADRSDDTRSIARDGSRFEGSVAVYSATFDDGTGETQYFLRDLTTAGEVRLWFTDDPDISPGTRVTVFGERTTDGIYVSHFDASSTIAKSDDPS